MMKACKCGSYAINHHCHGRDGSDDDLCDVCYWRKRAEQPAQQEPVGRLESDPDEGHVFVPRIDGDWSMLGKDLYTSPPAQLTWVGLTDEEREAVINNSMTPACVAIAIEAKLKEKNNG